MKELEEQKSGQRVTDPGKKEKKCRSCRASTEFRGHTLFSRGGFIMPAEIRLCPRCESAGVFVVDHIVNHRPLAVDEPAFNARRLRVERHDGLLEVMCPKCGASMFFVQHSNVSFGNVDVLAESWICECGTTLEIAKDS
jgi:ribosomal protein S27AE